MAHQYDIIVIGTGPAGGTVATGCHKTDLRVTVVESQGYGGTCPLRGCKPKKVLVAATEVINRSLVMQGKGIAHGSRTDWPELIRFNGPLVLQIAQVFEKQHPRRLLSVVQLRGAAGLFPQHVIKYF